MRGKYLLLSAVAILLILMAYLSKVIFIRDKNIISPLSKIGKREKIKALQKYSFENLRRIYLLRDDFSNPENIKFEELLKNGQDFSSYRFSFTSNEKTVSGLANLPKKPGVYPLILQFRGYIHPESYQTGDGTARSGEIFAKNGFITLAPDFLGYGQSSSPSADIIEARLETYTTSMDLLKNIKWLNNAIADVNEGIKADVSKIGIWGHSNGGHIAISVLEISGKQYPTVLWNPVSKPFPYSILYYSDELPDYGKKLRRILSEFEKDYDIDNFNPGNYFPWINAPIELHQAGSDEAVPQRWSDEFYQILKNFGIEVTYFTYPEDNHDFNRGNWNTVVARNISFYREKFSD